MIDRPPPIVCVGFADWDAELWTNQQHLMSRLARDRQVLFVESLGLRRPALVRRDVRRVLARLVRALTGPRDRDGVLVLSPLVLPFHGSAVVRRINAWLLPVVVGHAARRAGLDRPVLWSYVPQAEALVEALRPRAIVYHCVDDIAEQKGVDGPSFRAAEARFVEAANLVLASAPALAERLSTTARELVYAPNVADTTLFAGALGPGAPDPATAALPSPRIVFTGAITATKLDFELVAELARQKPTWSIALVGPVGLGDSGTDVSALAEVPNVHLLGARAYADLPAVLRAADAAIIPYQVNELTRSVFPMKVFEYLAAGLPIVATALPSLQGADDDVQLATGVDDFAAALEKCLALDDDEHRRERSARALPHSWDARVEEIRAHLAALDAPQHPVRTVIVTAFTPTVSSGRGLRTFGVAKALAAHGPVDLVYQRTGDGRPDPAYADDPRIRLHAVAGSHGLRRAWTYATARLRGVPRGFARGIWPETLDRVRAFDDGTCRIVADGPIPAAALQPLGHSRVIYNSHNLESTLQHLLTSPDVGSQRQLERFESRLIGRAAETWVVSRNDLDGAAALAAGARLRIVPNVVDTAAVPVRSADADRVALFVGDHDYPPNQLAVRFLLDEVAPALWAMAPDVRLVLAGRGTDSVRPTDPRVEPHGFVDDLDALYDRTGCAVVPLLEGGGSPLKFLEALAHGVPVVATPRAASGLERLTPGRDFLLAEANGAAFARGIVESLDPATAERVGRAGRAAVEEHYSLHVLAEELGA